MYFIGYENEGFESAKKDTVIPALYLKDAFEYALHDFYLGLIDSFQIYNAKGELIANTEKPTRFA